MILRKGFLDDPRVAGVRVLPRWSDRESPRFATIGATDGLGPENVTVLIDGAYAYIRTVYDGDRDLVQRIKLFDGEPTIGDNRSFDFQSVCLISNENLNTDSTSMLSGSVLVHNVSDDTAPMQYNGTSISAGHGANFVKTVTVASHDKTVEDVGSIWANDGVHFTLLYIESATKLWLMSANTGASAEKWSFDVALSGNFAHVSGATHTDDIAVSSSTTTQLEPAVKNQIKKLYLNGNSEVTGAGLYTCRYLSAVNNYQIVNPVSALASIASAVGSESQPPLNNGDAQITVELEYVFDEFGGCKLNVSHYYDQLVDIQSEPMGLQSAVLNTGAYAGRWEYWPGSLPRLVGTRTWDMRTLEDTTVLPTASLQIDTAQWADANNPPYRFLRFLGTDTDDLDLAFAMMYVPDIGTSANRKTLTNRAVWMYTDGKTYPMVANSAAGDIASGTEYTAVSFRGYSKPGLYSANADAVFFFQVGNVWYLTVDYHQVCDHDQLSLPAPLRFKTVEQLDVHADVTVHAAVTDGIGIQISCAGTYGYAVLKLT